MIKSTSVGSQVGGCPTTCGPGGRSWVAIHRSLIAMSRYAPVHPHDTATNHPT